MNTKAQMQMLCSLVYNKNVLAQWRHFKQASEIEFMGWISSDALKLLSQKVFLHW